MDRSNFTARYCSSRKLSVRFIAAAWCLVSTVTFIFYHATMISCITSYQLQPLIQSAEELVRRQDVHLVVEKGYNVEMVLKVYKIIILGLIL